MMCECWIELGVVRTEKSEYRCAACGEDKSIIFNFLSSRDDPLADRLMEKGGITLGNINFIEK